jgi:hypothetical protein
MNKKTASLAYPSNPLAAMRDLQDLDALPKPVAFATSSAESSVVAHQQSSEPSSQRGSPESSAETLAEAKKPTPKLSSVTRHKELDSESDSSNPMADAVWSMLQKPYTADVRKGPFTVSTVKIPTEVWERLGWVSTLTGQPKQEIISEALKTHFEKVLRSKK